MVAYLLLSGSNTCLQCLTVKSMCYAQLHSNTDYSGDDDNDDVSCDGGDDDMCSDSRYVDDYSSCATKNS